ncbi:MAG: ACT domain-containing protein, partial [Kordiimonadaceae bacterium]|nr:ACT domain-containing protein [Kordiimonadaceae bacterium]
TQVLSSFKDVPGTLVVGEDEIVEKEVVTGIAYSRGEAKVTVVGLEDSPGRVSNLFAPLADEAVNVDMIVQSASDDGRSTDVTFTVPEDDLSRVVKILEDLKGTLKYRTLLSTGDVVKVSVIGVGMRSHVGVARKMFDTLAEKSINVQVIATSEIKISVIIDAEYTELAVRALHTAYGLDAAE